MPERIIQSKTRARVVVFVLGSLALALSVADIVESAERQRIPWTESRLVGSPDPPLPYRVMRAYEKLPLFAPVYLRSEPGTDRIFFVDHKGDWKEPGGLRYFADKAEADSSKPLIALDRLVYGFCFHPKYRENKHLYLITNGPMSESNKQNRISRFTVSESADVPGELRADSELVILEWDSNGHNGGDLAFGPDGFLYCPTGDGTSDSDTLVTGQGLGDLLAVMLRLDVDHPTADKPYSIPPDNPFINVPDARPEIWAYGFRNPWRMDYDHESNQLWLGQNGQDLWEQVYLIRRGENYGWSVQEGGHPFYVERPRGAEPIVAPMADHHHSESRSLTGGVVYRGSKLPDLVGCFIYGDYSTGKIWAIRHDGTKVTFHREIADTTLQIAGFSMNAAGELLVVDHAGGFYRLEPMPPQEPTNFPRMLSDTGLFASVAEHRLLPSVIPYSVNVQFWSDGAHKERWLAVPGEEKIDYTSTRGWNFPNGSVLVKSFALEKVAGQPETRRWIETRLMVRQQNEWIGYSYRWNEEQTDAELLDSSSVDVEFEIQDPAAEGGVRKQTWHYPSRAECMVCHSRAVNYVLGLSENQMNREHDYGSEKFNQIQMLSELGMFTKPLPKPVEELTRLSDPLDKSLDLKQRAASYLHANCSNCHVEAGGGNAQFSVEIDAKPEQAKLIDVKPVHTTFDLQDARLVAPGSPERSLLFHRMQRRGHGQMPPLGTSLVDKPAVELIREWILQLPTDTASK
ncbi:MAG: PQQ-dependent sugar dehydrogenase [Planctomycetales bacterium]|nr:PQQ-dependent sugar dehydrogenase [Planctomycetales bacterium]